MNPTSKRRFIAGAVCPRCKEMDTIIMYRENDMDHRECVSCDFAEQANASPPAEELPTRVSAPAEDPAGANDEIQVVTIIDPSTGK